MGTQGNVIVGFALGSGFLKAGAYDAAEGACVDIGYTEGGAEITVEREYYQKKVDQEIGILDALKTSEKATLKVSFAEASLINIAKAMDYNDAVAVAAGVLSVGGNGDTNYKTIYLNVKGVTGGTRKYKFHRCVAIAGGTHKYVRNDKTIVSVEFLILQDTTKTADQQLFTCTETGADTTPPTIAMTTPASGGDVTKATKGTVVLTITETNSMDQNTIVYGDTVQIINVTTGTAPTLVAGTIAYDAVAKTITFTPTAVWVTLELMNIIVTTGLADSAGNHLATTYIDDFKVSA
jgi:hypothetical protein